jgi:hypothetical protein
LFRRFLTDLAKWLLCFDPHLRFQHKLQTYRSLGNIVESHRLSHISAAMRGVLEQQVELERQ